METVAVPEGSPLALRSYRLLSAALVPLAPALLSHRLRRGKEHPARLKERYGHSEIRRPPGPLVWIHCASVGELLTVVPLVGQIRAREFGVLCTSGTVTSANIAELRLPSGTIHQFVTLDAPRFVNRFLDHWRPDLALFVESDLWPNLIVTAAERGIPLILVNGRLSEQSYRRWRWAPHTIAALLHSFDLCLAQSAAHAGRYRDLGAPRVSTTGNLKLDVPEPPADANALAALRSAIGGRSVIAGASTHAGEETVLIDTHRRLRNSFPRLLTIIAPRHPDRGRGIVEIARAAELPVKLRSRGELPDADTDIYVADTMGELGLFYRLSPIVFMGGSLVRHGGQNPIEAIKLGAAIIHGPHVFNFTELYAALDQSGGARAAETQEALVKQLGQLLADPAMREKMQRAGHGVVEQLGGALERTLAALEPYLLQLRLEMGAANA